MADLAQVQRHAAEPETAQRHAAPTGALALQLNASPRAIQLKSLSDQMNSVQRMPNRTGLPDGLKSGIENLSGLSMDSVKVRYNSSRPAAMQAHAFTQGNEIHVGPGQERHLPHEAWHVVQQAQGRVRPTAQLAGGVPLNDDHSLEREADTMGSRALMG